MSASAGRLTMGVALIVALWIAVYWWWPADQPPISFDAGPATAAGASAAGVPATQQTPPAPPVEPAVQPAPAPAPDKPQPPTPAVIPPQFTEHTVQRGETFESISRRHFGTSRHADAIARANPFVNPTGLKAGRVIRVPKDPLNIQGIPAGPPAADKPATTPAAREYTVRDGDSLSAISQRMYGSVKYVDLIFEANRDVLKSPDAVRAGQKLRIPPKPETPPQ